MEARVIVYPPTKMAVGNIMLNSSMKRVAAYCRVSTNSDKQLNSFHNQLSYYIKLIGENKEWQFADIYADEGITGTSTEKRNEFHRMIEDCRKGKIDIVLVKSISRFARNTVDVLSYIRELRTLNIDVYFENERIHSIDPSSEFLITIHAMQAQEQSINIATNRRWSIRKKMEMGTWLPTFTGYGFIVQDDELVKDNEVAHVVEMIKELYLNGYSINKIIQELNDRKIPSPKNRSKWNETTILNVLTNPLYRGHIVAQKTFTEDTFPFVRSINYGQLPKYHYLDDHEPYINEEEAKQIDEIMMLHRSLTGARQNDSMYNFRNYLSGNVICKKCGSSMNRVLLGKDKKVAYKCVKHIADSKDCDNKHIMESTIQEAFIKLFNKLKHDSSLFDEYIEDLKQLNMVVKSELSRKELEHQYQEIKEQIYETANKFNCGIYESAFYVHKIKELKQLADELLNQMITQRIYIGYDDEIRISRYIQSLLKKSEYMHEFDEMLYIEMIDHIEVQEQSIIYFHLKNKLILKEVIPLER